MLPWEPAGWAPLLSLCELRCKESWQEHATTIGELVLEPREGKPHWPRNHPITLGLKVGSANVLEAPV